MKAVQFQLTIPRYLLGKALGRVFPTLLWSGASCTIYRDIPEPDLPGDKWLKIKSIYGGICGSDLNTIRLDTSTYFDPYSSYPFVFGHENYGTVTEVGSQVTGWQVGDRAVVEPWLWCGPRGFEELCEFCERGEINRCIRQTEGDLSPGVQTGNCPDTGGSWSAYYLGHSSQVHHIPDNVNDENALMTEPFAIGLHAALQSYPSDDDTVLIIGAGTIGLTVLAALRALGSKANILVLARYPFQAEAAQRLGASEAISPKNTDVFEAIASRTRAKKLKPIIGPQIVVGGAHRTFECTGTSSALDDALRLTTNGGEVVFVGGQGEIKKLDWSSVFAQELTVKSSYIYNHVEPYNGKRWNATELALHLMESGVVDLGWMVTHKYRIGAYKQALSDQWERGTNKMIKGVFEFN